MAASGSKSRIITAARRILDKQAWGSKKGRFAVQRTLEHLKKGSAVLDEDVKTVNLNLPSTINQRDNYGARRFLYENVPQLKFANPHVVFTRTKDNSRDAELQMVFVNGKKAKMSTLQKTPSQLMEEVLKLAVTSRTKNSNLETTPTEDSGR